MESRPGQLARGTHTGSAGPFYTRDPYWTRPAKVFTEPMLLTPGGHRRPVTHSTRAARVLSAVSSHSE
jgi:hypothetical protein